MSVTGFTPYTTYNCWIYANNSRGAGPNVTTPIRTLQDSRFIIMILSVHVMNCTCNEFCVLSEFHCYSSTCTVAIKYVFFFASAPETPPTNVTVTGATSSSVIITWSLPSVPNGIITRYTIYLDLLNGTTSFILINGSLTEYTVIELSPYQLVQVRVSASTDIGEGSQSSPVEGRSLESGRGCGQGRGGK